MRRMYSKPQLLEAVEQEAKTNGIKVFEDIVDKDGHKRFIEGSIEKVATAPAGITFNYAKWSLSGSHLLIVVAGNLANATALVNGGVIAEITSLPSWVLDKIYITFSTRVVSSTVVDLRADNWSNQTVIMSLNKESSKITIRTEAALTATDNRHFRIAFDLLIDNN